MVLWQSPLTDKANKAPERVSALPKVTQLVHGRSGLQGRSTGLSFRTPNTSVPAASWVLSGSFCGHPQLQGKGFSATQWAPGNLENTAWAGLTQRSLGSPWPLRSLDLDGIEETTLPVVLDWNVPETSYVVRRPTSSRGPRYAPSPRTWRCSLTKTSPTSECAWGCPLWYCRSCYSWAIAQRALSFSSCLLLLSGQAQVGQSLWWVRHGEAELLALGLPTDMELVW